MHVELVIDLEHLGRELGEELGRETPVFPSLGKIALLWRNLGLSVSQMHVVMPGHSLSSPVQASMQEERAKQWWQTESVYLEDEDFDVNIVHSSITDEGPVGHEALVVTTALARSDQPATEVGLVVVMSNAPSATVAVSHARGAAVMVASTSSHSRLAHICLDPSWMAGLTNRLATLSMPDVTVHNGTPARDGIPIGTPYGSLLGRDDEVAQLPSFAESAVVLDREFFTITSSGTEVVPSSAGVATMVQMLGLGELVHVETADESIEPELSEVTLLATLYRLATDHPDAPIIIASSRPALVVATSDLDTFSLSNQRRFLRLCLPARTGLFDESTFHGTNTTPRVLLEQSLSEPLFADDDTTIMAPTIHDREDDGASSPTLVLFTNPNNAREISADWRTSTGRRFLALGPDVLVATPADDVDAEPLPVSLGGCTDFALRRPDLQEGSVVEGILDTTRQRWIVLSDPIERRAMVRSASGYDTDETPLADSREAA